MEGIRSTLWSTSIVFLVLVMISPSSSAPMGLGPKLPISFTFFLHDNLTPNSTNATVVQVATASGIRTPVTAPSKFGDTVVFASPLRTTMDPNSTLLGISAGMLTTLNKPQQFFYQFTASYNTTEYVGTFSGQGKVTPLEPSWEVSITGGTGDFRSARGYVVVNTSVPTSLSDVIFEYKVHLLAAGY